LSCSSLLAIEESQANLRSSFAVSSSGGNLEVVDMQNKR
jgi:hypothetical protein